MPKDIIDAAYAAWSIRRAMQLQVPAYRREHGWGVAAILLDGQGDYNLPWGWRTVAAGAHPDDDDIFAAQNVGPDEVVVRVTYRQQFPWFAVLPLTPPPDETHPVTWFMDGQKRWFEVTRNTPDPQGSIMRHLQIHGLVP